MRIESQLIKLAAHSERHSICFPELAIKFARSSNVQTVLPLSLLPIAPCIASARLKVWPRSSYLSLTDSGPDPRLTTDKRARNRNKILFCAEQLSIQKERFLIVLLRLSINAT